MERFTCAFCDREVRRDVDTTSVSTDGYVSSRFLGAELRLNEEFCTIKCLLDYITAWHAWEQAHAGGK